jgi:hypothetical protein
MAGFHTEARRHGAWVLCGGCNRPPCLRWISSLRCENSAQSGCRAGLGYSAVSGHRDERRAKLRSRVSHGGTELGMSAAPSGLLWCLHLSDC